MAGFLKIDTQTLRSTTYRDKPAWDVFFAAMLIAAQDAPRTFSVDLPQLKTRSLEPTGWVLPAGEYGFARTSAFGIIDAAKVDEDVGFAALDRLAEPEPESRSQVCEGRRLVRVDGGFVVINMVEFRHKDQTNAERQRRYRERKKAGGNALRNGGVTEAEAEVKAEAPVSDPPAADPHPTERETRPEGVGREPAGIRELRLWQHYTAERSKALESLGKRRTMPGLTQAARTRVRGLLKHVGDAEGVAPDEAAALTCEFLDAMCAEAVAAKDPGRFAAGHPLFNVRWYDGWVSRREGLERVKPKAKVDVTKGATRAEDTHVGGPDMCRTVMV